MDKKNYLRWWLIGSLICVCTFMIVNANAKVGGNLEVTSAITYGVSLLSTLASVIVNVVYKLSPSNFE